MAKNKTAETKASVAAYLKNIKDEQRRKDCTALAELMSKYSGMEAKMWGTAIVGFGSYHYKYDSGHEGDAPLAGFSSRSNAIALYLAVSPDQREDQLKKLGKHKATKGCIYIQKMADVDIAVLGKMVKNSVQYKRS